VTSAVSRHEPTAGQDERAGAPGAAAARVEQHVEQAASAWMPPNGEAANAISCVSSAHQPAAGRSLSTSGLARRLEAELRPSQGHGRTAPGRARPGRSATRHESEHPGTTGSSGWRRRGRPPSAAAARSELKDWPRVAADRTRVPAGERRSPREAGRRGRRAHRQPAGPADQSMCRRCRIGWRRSQPRARFGIRRTATSCAEVAPAHDAPAAGPSGRPWAWAIG